MGHVRWMAVACDTVLSLVDVEYKPLAGLLGLCRQVFTILTGSILRLFLPLKLDSTIDYRFDIKTK